MSDDNAGCIPWAMTGMLLLLIVVGLSFAGCQKERAQWITDDRALERFRDMAGTDDVQIIRHTNSSPLVGDPKSVTYELLIDGQHVSGHCRDGWWSPLICRIYVGTE